MPRKIYTDKDKFEDVKIEVDFNALYEIVKAFHSPPHVLRELQAIKDLPKSMHPNNSVRILTQQVNSFIDEHNLAYRKGKKNENSEDV